MNQTGFQIPACHRETPETCGKCWSEISIFGLFNKLGTKIDISVMFWRRLSYAMVMFASLRWKMNLKIWWFHLVYSDLLRGLYMHTCSFLYILLFPIVSLLWTISSKLVFDVNQNDKVPLTLFLLSPFFWYTVGKMTPLLTNVCKCLT